MAFDYSIEPGTKSLVNQTTPERTLLKGSDMEEIAHQTGYTEVNGLRMYYEIHGSGEPLILIHGGAFGIPMFGPTLPELARTRQVIAVELQGHGRTTDIDRPLSYPAMADDVAGLMGQLGIDTANVLGVSLGGGVALQFIIRHPERVRKLVLVSTPFKRDGWFPEVLAAFDQMGPETGEPMKQSPLAQLFPNVDWSVLFTKIGELQRQPYDWSAQVANVAVPTLLVYADADAITPQHMVEFFGLLGGGQRDAGLDGANRPANQLAILPGRTHYDVITAPLVVPVVGQFLDAPGT